MFGSFLRCLAKNDPDRPFLAVSSRTAQLSYFMVVMLGIWLLGSPASVYGAECPAGSPVNINTDDETRLDTLFGIGPAKAADIVAYREANGYFLKTVDLQNVSGIGPETYNNIKLCITVGSEPPVDTNKETDNYETVSDSDTKTQPDNQNKSSTSGTSIIEGPLDDNFHLAIKAPKVVYVHQTFSLDAEPSNVVERYRNRIKYSWNFGDGEAQYKQYVTHQYQYPGTYVIVLQARYLRSKQVSRSTITVLPVNFSITRSPTGDIQINNDAKYEINLTGYRIKSNKTVVLPENTILLPGSTITIPRTDLGATSLSLVRLFDEQQVLVASTQDVKSVSKLAPADTVATITTASAGTEPDFTFAESEQTVEPKVLGAATSTIVKDSEIEVATNSAKATVPIPHDTWPYLGLVGLLAVGTFGVLFKSSSLPN